MSYNRIDERYSRLMCGYNDLCVNKGKYTYTTCDDFMLGALTMMARSIVVGSNACLVLLYDNHKKADKLTVLTISQNEEKIARMLLDMSKDECKKAKGDYCDTGYMHIHHQNPDLRALYAMMQSYVRNGEERSAIVVLSGYYFGRVYEIIRVGSELALKKLWHKADGSRSDLSLAMNAALRWYRHKYKKETESIRLQRLMDESEII